MKRLLTLYCTFLLLGSPAAALETIPAAPGRILDSAEILTQPQALEKRLRQLEKTTGVQMAIVIRPQPPADESLEAYATRLFNSWGIGQRGKNNGLLFLSLQATRQMRLEVGSGLNQSLSDAEAKRLLDQWVRPAFRQAQYQQGLENLVTALEQRFTRAETGESRMLLFALLASVLGLLTGLFFWIRQQRRRARQRAEAARRQTARRPANPRSGRNAPASRGRRGSAPYQSAGSASSYEDESWRRGASESSYDSSSSSDFGGGSSDGGGASSDW